MAPKQDRVYARGRSKCVALSAFLVIGSDYECDPEYVPPGTSTPSCVARAARTTPKKVASGVVTASQSDEELTLTGTSFGSATNEEGAFGSLGVLWSEEASRSAEVPAPATAAASASSDEADSSTPGSPGRALTPVLTSRTGVLMAAMLAGFEVDFAWLLQAVMHERAFKVTTTYPFPCMIFSLCRSVGVPIWHVDQLKTPLGTVDIDLIRDEANELAPRRGPRPDFPPLRDNLDETEAQARTATQAASTDTTSVESILGSSTAPSSSRSAPLSALKSIAEAEERLERRMVEKPEQKIDEVHQRLDAFELRVLDRPAPPVDVVDPSGCKPDEDTVMAALFATPEIPPPPPRDHAKRSRGREEDEARARKKERREMEAARRASLAEEEARQMRAGGTADSVVDAEDTSEGVQITEVVGSGEPDPPA
ncbi:hypothetical protein EJD97_021133 [Solanum chilense]|uniref:Uncharacterized protein n=1 Tax=Solanum chilense TaxID=4083 RepID=A0A6N2CAC8_SOLCI|nr:hypothetical protein EJD97_021133 [Solanum chilense]